MANQNEASWCERLYEAEAAQFILYGRALGLSHGEAEDVLQDTFLALLRQSHSPAKPRFYALRAFRHRALNYKRTVWRRLKREMESHHWFERRSDASLSEEAALRCLERLPREQREVIVLRIWHGHTYETIGNLLEVSPNTVAGRYRYGMEKLRACLKGQDYERLESTGEPISFLETASPLGSS
jgi:RNA polymerase sigma-70 factor, ECF subfamily